MITKIHKSRYNALQDEFSKPYFLEIQKSLDSKRAAGDLIYPEMQDIFAAYDLCPLDEIQVVILGQDPYHGAWQAHWLSFSVREWVKKPPSLKNICKEIHADLWISSPESWDLSRWAQQWVFLLNSVLTVTHWKPASHSKLGRQRFTDTTIRTISKQKESVVFLLRWNYAQSKKDLIHSTKHLILEAPHPSPLSAYRGFLWCWHFGIANAWLDQKWMLPIRR